MEHEEREQLGGNADWMSRLPAALLDVPLWNLAIPGSHDSMSYCLDVSSPVCRTAPPIVRSLDRFLPCWTRPCVARWAATQQCTLSQQCDLGVRFFDLRIAKKPRSDARLWFVHGLYTLTPVKKVLEELDSWLDAHPKEVVIFCCSHFETMCDEDFIDLANFIVALFGEKLCPSQETPTLRSCWSRQRQAVAYFEDERMVRTRPQLWTDLLYIYADSPDPSMVISYLDDMKKHGRPATFYVMGLNLTEDTAYVVLHPFQTMKKMTTRGLSALLGWVSQQSPGPEAGRVNIICCDFVDVSRFCSLVIGLNHKLLGRAASPSSVSDGVTTPQKAGPT
ncbi:uncharacterized protein V6R79_018363 [Siganus canaliculatus]